MKNLFIIIVMVFIAGCNNKTAVQEKDTATDTSHNVILTDAQLKNAGIETVTVSQKEMAITLRVNGKIDVPPQKPDFSKRAAGGIYAVLNCCPVCM